MQIVLTPSELSRQAAESLAVLLKYRVSFTTGKEYIGDSVYEIPPEETDRMLRALAYLHQPRPRSK